MSEWINVVSEGALAPGEHAIVEIDGVDVAVFNINGDYYAIQDVCTHDGTEIASGQIEGCEIICPRHGARFCLKTGKVLSAPAYEDVDSHAVRVQDGFIQVNQTPA